MTVGSSRQTNWQPEFEEIRCYRNHEINTVLNRLSEDDDFIGVLNTLLHPGSETEEKHSRSQVCQAVAPELKVLRQINSVESLQSWIAERIFPIIAQSYEGLSVTGYENLNASDAYIFVSNHRDIVMDPLLLNKVLLSMGAPTANCAIGDNLLKNKVANDLARLNRCFKVIRSIKSPKAILKAMKVQSAYIQRLHFTERENIWIAQKEGRSKDNRDKTNPALIKMLSLAKGKDVAAGQFLNTLNIVPVSFSYEWDPCDIDKARELEAQSESASYTKDRLDDLIAINKGLTGFNGKIGIHFGKTIVVEEEDRLAHKQVANKIDASIQQNYSVYPVNFAAYKKLNRVLPESCSFDKQALNAAQKQLEQRIENEPDEIKKRVLMAYAAPLG